MEIKNGAFRKKKVYFSQVSNSALRDKELSLKAKGLYSLIQSYITIEGFTLYKSTLKKNCKESVTAFDGAWSELKNAGYLMQYKIKAENGTFHYEYELLDEKIPVNTGTNSVQPHPQNPYVDNPPYGEAGVYSNTNPNKTDLNNTERKNKTPTAINSVGENVIPDEIDVFVDETYPTLYSEHYSAEHPKLAAYQRNRTKQILREFSVKYAVSDEELEAAAKEFSKREISDGNIKAFADSKMLYYMLVSTLRTDLTAYA